MVDLLDTRTNTWKTFDEKMRRLRSIPQDLQDLTMDFIEDISQATHISWDNQLDPNLWEWSDDTPIEGGFLLKNAQIYTLPKEKSTK